MSIEISNATAVLGGIIVVLLAGGGAEPAAAADDLAELSRLVQAEGDEYIRLRDFLLKKHLEPWDDGGALNESWDAGLAAFILNQRVASPETFARLDKEYAHPSRGICGQYPPISDQGIPQDAVLAFLFERMWKDIPVKERGISEARAAYEVLVQCVLRELSAKRSFHTALWIALWQQVDDDRFRVVALAPLCADPSLSVEPTIREILEADDSLRAKDYCLASLEKNTSQRAKDLVLDAWDILRAQSYTPVVASSANPRARELAYSIVLDPGEPLLSRLGTIGALGRYPQATDRAFLRKFFAEVDSDQLKGDVLSHIPKWFPLDMYREPVREILKASSDPKLIQAAIGALTRGYKAPVPLWNTQTGQWEYGSRPRADSLDLAAWHEDVALMEELRGRDTLPGELKTQVERHLAGMYELRRSSE